MIPAAASLSLLDITIQRDYRGFDSSSDNAPVRFGKISVMS